MIDTMVLLVSEQAAPNLLPVLDPTLKPHDAVLVVSSKMESRARDLETVLGEAGVRTSRIDLENEHDFGQMQEAILKIAASRDAQSIALNVTGGTKLMALAAQSVATMAKWRLFYVDVDTDEVIWLEKDANRQPLHQQLRLRHYLRGYGFELEEKGKRPHLSQQHDDLLRTLIVQVGSLEKPLAQLNWLAQQGEDRKTLRVQFSSEQQKNRGLDALLRNFEEAGVLTVRDGAVHFSGEVDRDFAKGGWLETHVFRAVCAAGSVLDLRDKAANLTVTDGGGVKNELDVAFMARNRLFVIECKTARMDRTEAPKANETLFKLSEICRRVGGLGTRGMLASYRKIGEAEKRLAAALHVEVVCGPDLARIDDRVRNWVKR